MIGVQKCESNAQFTKDEIDNFYVYLTIMGLSAIQIPVH